MTLTLGLEGGAEKIRHKLINQLKIFGDEKGIISYYEFSVDLKKKM
jgi:hypothetical protein